MLQIQKTNFVRAIQKARMLNPSVQHNGAQYFVRRIDGQKATIIFRLRNDAIWATCDCPAGRGRFNHGEPQPCYHIAAALLYHDRIIAEKKRLAELPRCKCCETAPVNPRNWECLCDDCAAEIAADFAETDRINARAIYQNYQNSRIDCHHCGSDNRECDCINTMRNGIKIEFPADYSQLI